MTSPSSIFSAPDTVPPTAQASPVPVEGTVKDEQDATREEEITTAMLFESLTSVEHQIPEMLAHIPPIMRSLVSESQEVDVRAHSRDYFEALNSIQITLRQVVRHLREVKASPSTLQVNNAPPTAFATALVQDESNEKPQLGLYASRIESEALDDLKNSLEKC